MEDENRKPDYRHTLAWLRRNRGLTQQELADISNVAAQTISRAERGRPISQKTFKQLCRALDVLPDPKVIQVNLLIGVRQKKES